MSAPDAETAASCSKATAALWEKLTEVLELLRDQPDAKTLFNEYLVVRSVVGEVNPVFADAVRVRLKVFCEGDGEAARTECDNLEAVSIHVVAYFNYTLFMQEMEELAVQARLRKSIGMEKTGLRFQRRRGKMDDPDASSPPSSADATNSAAAEADKKKKQKTIHNLPTARYKPPVLIPLGCVRVRRAARASQAGKLMEVVARMERLCVVSGVRHYDTGRQLMSAAEELARSVCHVRWSLVYVPLDARDFYSKVGYVAKDGWVFEKNDRPHVVMIKCLADAAL